MTKKDQLHRRVVQLGEWSARFDPRLNDIAGTDFVVVVESWDRNDYEVNVEHGFVAGTVLDVGANIGAFTVLASKAGAGRVVACEPERENFARLEYHVALNGCSNVELRNVAVVADGAPGEVSLVGCGGGARVDYDRTADPAIGSQLVDTIEMSRLIEENAPVKMLKIDIEGGEYAIFDRLDPDVLRNVERIAMEFHSPNDTHLAYLHGDEFAGLVTKMAEAGRVCVVGRPSLGGLLHWNRY